MSKFDAHGDYKINVFGRVLAVKVSGSWNEEMATRYRKELDELLLSMAEKPFAHVLDVRQWDLATPAAIEILKRPQPEIAIKSKVLRAQIIRRDSLPSIVSVYHIDEAKGDNYAVSSFSELIDDLLLKISDAQIADLEQFFC